MEEAHGRHGRGAPRQFWTAPSARAAGSRRVATYAAERSGPRDGLGIDGAADVLRALTTPDLTDRLLLRRGWGWNRFERWAGREARPASSLEVMPSDAQHHPFRAPTAALFPGLAILLICLAVNRFGDALQPGGRQ